MAARPASQKNGESDKDVGVMVISPKENICHLTLQPP